MLARLERERESTTKKNPPSSLSCVCFQREREGGRLWKHVFRVVLFSYPAPFQDASMIFFLFVVLLLLFLKVLSFFFRERTFRLSFNRTCSAFPESNVGWKRSRVTWTRVGFGR